MRLRHLALTVVGAACARGGAGPPREPAPRFGRVTALRGALPVVGAWGPDSVVAVYLPESGTLQIEGSRLRSGSRLPIVRVMMVCAAPPAPGLYPVAGGRTPVHAEAYLGRGGWLGWWDAQGHRSADRAFMSDSTPPGVLELDTLDLAAGRVYGRFRAAVRRFDPGAGESLAVAGTVWGRVRTIDWSRWRTGPVRWAPGFDRDCAAIRRPLPGVAAHAAGVLTPNEALQLSGMHGRPSPALGTVSPRHRLAPKARS